MGCTKTSVYCEGFPVFKLEILAFEGTDVVLRQAFTVMAFLCLDQKYELIVEGTDVVLRQAFTVKAFLCLNWKY